MIKAINRGVVIKALILKVKNHMVKKYKRFRRLMEKIVELKNEVVTQKIKIKTSRNRRKENTPATGITSGSSTLIKKKKKKKKPPKIPEQW